MRVVITGLVLYFLLVAILDEQTVAKGTCKSSHGRRRRLLSRLCPLRALSAARSELIDVHLFSANIPVLFSCSLRVLFPVLRYGVRRFWLLSARRRE
jgi:hypothetical protein